MRKIYKGICILTTLLVCCVSFDTIAQTTQQSRNPFSNSRTDHAPASKMQNDKIKPLPVVVNSTAFNLALHEDHLLSKDLHDWAKVHGVKLLWDSNKDYLIYNTIVVAGNSMDTVLGSLGDVFSSENYGLVIKLYQKNNVLLIDEQ